MIEKHSVFVGLLRADGSEPSALSGYKRIPAGESEFSKIPEVVSRQQIIFDDVQAPGYGEITAIAVYHKQESGRPVWLQELPAAVDVHEGVIPIIVRGQLLRGLEVQAQVTMQSADLCRF